MIKGTPALVVDVTYQCNASCAYCQWGTPGASGREAKYDLRVPAETLAALGTKRVVLSGGEPLLRSDLEGIISYYRGTGIDAVVVITNGLRLFPRRIDSLIDAGLTGISASLDGVTAEIASHARGMNKWQHDKIMKNFKSALSRRKTAGENLEFVVNTVLSKANLDRIQLSSLLDFCNHHSVDFLKFTPVFDDGYLGVHAPWLKLTGTDAPAIRELGKIIPARATVKTNPPQFWNTVADIVGGVRRLQGKSCGLDKGQALLAHGELKFCAWLKNPVYSRAEEVVTPDTARNAQLKFKHVCASCETGPWCFCLQDIEQEWETA